jgi:hypothetical protein
MRTIVINIAALANGRFKLEMTDTALSGAIFFETDTESAALHRAGALVIGRSKVVEPSTPSLRVVYGDQPRSSQVHRSGRKR